MHLLQIFVAPIHVSLGTPKGDNIRLSGRVRECDLDLVELVTDLPDLAALGTYNAPVESLLNQDVTRLLVLLEWKT